MSLKIGKLASDPSLSRSCDGLAAFPPRRLSDHLCWRCSSCKSLVTTKETHFHLIECLRTFLDPMIKSVKRPTKSESDAVEEITTSPPATTLVRPQTRVIRRPTPNLKHPVIAESNQDKLGKSKNRIKSFHHRFLTHDVVGKSKSLDPTPTIKIDTCKTEVPKSLDQEDASKLLSKLSLGRPIKNHNNNNINKSTKNANRKKVSRTVSQRNPVPELEPDPEWLEHLTKLKPCRKCKRTFFPERLLVHEPACNAEPLKINTTVNSN